MRINPRSVPKNLRVHVRHFHGDALRELPFRPGGHYATVAEVFDRKTGEHLAVEWACCGPRDRPNRKTGYDIAVGRALKQAYNKLGINDPAQLNLPL